MNRDLAVNSLLEFQEYQGTQIFWISLFIIGAIFYFAAMLVVVIVPWSRKFHHKTMTGILLLSFASLTFIGLSYMNLRGDA